MPKKNTRDKREESDEEDDEQGQVDVREQLGDIDDWGDTEEKALGDVPDGTYAVELTDVNINNAKSSGRLQASFEMTILDTDQRGRKLWTHFGLDDVDQRGYLRGALAKLGEEWPDKPSLLPDVLEKLQKTYAMVKTKTKKYKDRESQEIMERNNTYFLKALDSDEVEPITDDEESDTDKDEAPSSKKDKAAAKKEKDKKPVAKEKKLEKDKNKKTDEKKTETVEGVTLDWKEDKFSKEQKSKLTKLAKEVGFDPDDYNNLIDLASDVGEYFGLKGKYPGPNKLDEEEDEKDEDE
jgi:hypothetical protein